MQDKGDRTKEKGKAINQPFSSGSGPSWGQIRGLKGDMTTGPSGTFREK